MSFKNSVRTSETARCDVLLKGWAMFPIEFERVLVADTSSGVRALPVQLFQPHCDAISTALTEREKGVEPGMSGEPCPTLVEAISCHSLLLRTERMGLETGRSASAVVFRAANS
jgi:hypothetical protein